MSISKCVIERERIFLYTTFLLLLLLHGLSQLTVVNKKATSSLSDL